MQVNEIDMVRVRSVTIAFSLVARALVACALAASGLGGCHEEPPATSTKSTDRPAARVDAGVARDAGFSSQPPDAGEPDAGVAGQGELIEGGSYGLRLDEVAGCGAPTGAAVPVATGRSWVGARFYVQAKISGFFVAPRDFTLERGGIILQARFIDPPALPRCVPLLAKKQLRPRQTLKGFVLFDVPSSFRAARGPTTLAYQPTRWGGARRAELRIPDCLDACSVIDPEEKRKPARARKQRRKDG